VKIVQDGINKPIIAKMGQDKGARISIKQSTFSHSRFCKGLISYKKGQAIPPKLLKNFFFAADSQVTQPTGFLAGYDPAVFIDSSSFINLNHGTAIQYLSVAGLGSQKLAGYPAVPYEPFDNLGIVLNLQGFPG